MFISDHDINVNYYRVREGTALHTAVSHYHRKCNRFVRYAEKLVKRFSADSAAMRLDFDGISVSGLNFDYDSAPICWQTDSFGEFRPRLLKFSLPYFHGFFRQAPDGIRFCLVGKDIIISVTPNKDGSICQVADADLLSASELGQVKQKANGVESGSLYRLGRYDWMPAPLANAQVFKASDKVIALASERFDSHFNKYLAFKHSRTGRLLNRALRVVGLGL